MVQCYTYKVLTYREYCIVFIVLYAVPRELVCVLACACTCACTCDCPCASSRPPLFDPIPNALPSPISHSRTYLQCSTYSPFTYSLVFHQNTPFPCTVQRLLALASSQLHPSPPISPTITVCGRTLHCLNLPHISLPPKDPLEDSILVFLL